MKLHGIGISPFVRKVLVAMDLKGLECERTDVRPGTRTPEYLAISPLGKVPAFEDDDFVVCDSNIIIEYLEEKYPETTVRPTDIQDRAKSRWLEEYGGFAVFPPAACVFTERLTKPYTKQQATDESAVEDAISNRFPPVFDYLEPQIPAEGFLFGELGLADISLCSPLINISYTGYEIDGKRWPKLKGWLARVMDHPIVAKRIQEEAPTIATLRNFSLPE